MQSIALPARRAFIAAILVFFLLYSGFAYAAIAVVVLFLIAWFVFPVKQPRDFCAGVVPAIDSLSGYLRVIANVIRQPESAGNNWLQQAEYNTFKSFLASNSAYPEWVYRSGFNPGLRSGFRYFLIQLEHAADLCCSIAYWLSWRETVANKSELSQLLLQSLKVNGDLLAALSRTMHHHAERTPKPANDPGVDFVADIIELEAALQRVVPGSLELLDMSQEYVYATALVRSVKELREVLLVLVAAVPV